ncbi:hypothetical protein HJC23_007835 [Cyclotella cryptica]|uniref:CN hydrolase domain-containing protein n=1 Tax=Cyclotella cryptica TaxID=29204 RepID=A0ABD3R0R8_9STRA|eukprot:CCRYP_000142-RB/>CCRYP_000142-RB protein AED:0.03 eAED:0.03 QI:2774/1/1/1/1/1/3/68/480
MAATERDGLLTRPQDTLSSPTPGWNCQTISNWALTCVVSLLVLVLIIDPRISPFGSSQPSVDESSASAATTESPHTSFSPHTEGRYYATQFISFTINTSGGSASDGECEGRLVDPKEDACYLGNEDVEKDVNHRLAILADVLRTLHNDVFKEDPEIDRDPRVLKILMVPEFFLRGPTGAYSTEEMLESDHKKGELVKLVDKIHEMISDPAFEDYLFVFGTIVAAESMDDGDGEYTAKDNLYFNFAPVYRGGAEDEESGHVHRYIILKRYISGADFLSRTELPNPVEFDMRAYDNAESSSVLAETFARRNMTVVTDNYLEIDGIKIGIEICLDHRMGSLYNNLRIKHNGELVDVQLVISAGMSIERGINPVKPGGVVYLTDGGASSAACLRTDTGEFDPNHVCRGKPDGLQHRPHGGVGYTNFLPLAGCIDMERDELLEGYYSRYQTQGCAFTLKTYGIDVMDEFSYYPPSIEIYPTVALP